MEILLVVFCTVVLLILIYITLSRKIARVEKRSLPEEIQAEMDTIITTFNRTADRNIDLLDDRVRSLEPLIKRGERLAEQLEGLVRRAEALSKLREKIQSPEPERPLEPPATTPLAGLTAANAYRAQTAAETEKVIPPPAPKPAKRTRRAKKTADEILREMSAAGRDPAEIAQALGITREEVLLKQKLASLSD